MKPSEINLTLLPIAKQLKGGKWIPGFVLKLNGVVVLEQMYPEVRRVSYKGAIAQAWKFSQITTALIEKNIKGWVDGFTKAIEATREKKNS